MVSEIWIISIPSEMGSTLVSVPIFRLISNKIPLKAGLPIIFATRWDWKEQRVLCCGSFGASVTRYGVQAQVAFILLADTFLPAL